MRLFRRRSRTRKPAETDSDARSITLHTVTGAVLHITKGIDLPQATDPLPDAPNVRRYIPIAKNNYLPIPRRIPEQLRTLLYEQPLGPEDAEAAAPAAEQTIEHALARLFLRLGPPPEPTELDYSPAGSGGGGAQQ